MLIVFICPFLGHTQGFHYYWVGGCFKVQHFLNFYFQVFLFIYIIFFDNSIAYFSFIVFNHYIRSIAIYFFNQF